MLVKRQITLESVAYKMHINQNKKGDGLSLNVIILAVIALLILIVLSVILLRGTGNFNKGVNACDGGCVFEKVECAQGYVGIPSSCTTLGGQKGNFCCTNIEGSQN